MADSGIRLILSCEHGGNRVPKPWQQLFAGEQELLASHRGYDPGVAGFARWLAAELHVPLHLSTVTRLLVDLNRSPKHPQLFSTFSRGLGAAERRHLLEEQYHPYRTGVEEEIAQLLETGSRVCHISLHTFTPNLDGESRNADIGLLYDPQRRREKAFCLAWQESLLRRNEGWRVRRNYPYRGAADSFVTLLRRRFPAESYLGFELELNHHWPLQGGGRWTQLQGAIRDTLQETLQK